MRKAAGGPTGRAVGIRRGTVIGAAVILLSASVAASGIGQGEASVSAVEPVVPVDLTSVESVIDALYASISGPAGAARDWDLFHLLLHPTVARLVSMDLNSDGEPVHRVMTPDDFIELSGPALVANGFFELEIGFTQERFGNMVHRFSAYDSRRSLDDPEPFSRGINSIQLLWSEGRWWIVTILWDRERPGNPIPEHLDGTRGRGG